MLICELVHRFSSPFVRRNNVPTVLLVLSQASEFHLTPLPSATSILVIGHDYYRRMVRGIRGTEVRPHL
jgi:hypothetical protein